MDSDPKVYVILNDLQIPWQDKRVLDNLVLPFIRDLQPDGVILNGDIVDSYQLSEFTKDPLSKWDLAREIKEAHQLMSRLGWVREKIWIGGNHEDRLRRYLWKHAPALACVPQVRFEALFGLAEHGFKWLPYGRYIRLGKLLVTHGSQVVKHSAMSAKAHFEKYGCSGLHGHTHRLGAYYITQRGVPSVAYENGCLCRLDPEYADSPNWQQGFSVVHVFRGGYFNVQQVPVINQRFIVWGGVKYGR